MDNPAIRFSTQAVTRHPKQVDVSFQGMVNPHDPFDIGPETLLTFAVDDHQIGQCYATSLRQLVFAKQACLQPTYLTLLGRPLERGLFVGVLAAQIAPASEGPHWVLPEEMRGPFIEPDPERFPWVFIDFLSVPRAARIDGTPEEETVRYLSRATGLAAHSFAEDALDSLIRTSRSGT